LRDVHHRRYICLVYGHGAPCPNHCQPGAYFVTICTRDRAYLFGHVVNGEMRLNPLGRMVTTCWRAIPHHFPRVVSDEGIIMPNHIHGIIVIQGGGEPRVRPDDCHQPDSGDHQDRPYGTMEGSVGQTIPAFESTTSGASANISWPIPPSGTRTRATLSGRDAVMVR